MASKIEIADHNVVIANEDCIINVTDDKGETYRIYPAYEGLMITKVGGLSKLNIEPYSGNQVHIK